MYRETVMESEEFHQVIESGLEIEKCANTEFDDDQKPKRTGNVWTGSAHIITAIIGSGVLSLAWAVAQLGWAVGIITLLLFSGVTFYTSGLLADCYRSPDPITGRRNYSYMDAVKSTLGGTIYIVCGIVQYANLSGIVVGYTITTSTSIAAILKSDCFHKRGKGTEAHEYCKFFTNPYMIGLGIVEIILSQIPNFHKLSILSIIAAIMSFGYSSIGMGLAIHKVISGDVEGTTSMTGIEDPRISNLEKIGNMFSAFGDIAFAYSYAMVLIEIQDTLKSSPPENKTMKKANMIAISTTTVFYTMCGCFGYAAFGNKAPGNLLTGFGFYDPYWLVDLANVFIVVHLVGAYQVLAQPIYSAVEIWARKKYPKSSFVMNEYTLIIANKFKLSVNLFRLTWRTSFVILVTILAMGLPFFNDILAFLGAIGYWPLSVYFPIRMYISQKKIKKWSLRWICLELINMVCLLVALAAAGGSIYGIKRSLVESKPFKYKV